VTLLRKPFGIDELVSEIRKYLATAPKPEDAQLAGGDLTVVRHGQEQGYGEEDRSHT
jgi:DNA-binding response OmpR family regulator